MRLMTGLLLGTLLVLLVGCAPAVVEDKTKDAKYHYLMGASALNEGSPGEALREFNLAEKYDSRDTEIQAGLAEAYLRKQAYEQAEARYKNALKLSGNDPK